MNIKLLSIIGAGLLLSSSTFAAGIKLPVVEILGKKYYMYEAKKNQTFFNIANEFHWDLEELMKINSNILSPMDKGTKIYYPCDTDSSSVATSEDIEALATPLTHLVKKGETVYSISLKYHLPIEKLYEYNPSSRKGIKAGEILKVGESSSSSIESNPEYYTIKRGDTLYQLARTYNTTVAAILTINPGISEANFKAGETIKLPASGVGIKSETKTVEETKVVGFSSYKVEKKDTWDSISEKTGVGVDELKQANTGVTLKNNKIIGVPQVVVDSIEKVIVEEDPRELTLSGVKEIYDDVHERINVNDSVGQLKIGILLAEPTSKKDLDFTRGFLTGVRKLKNDSRINVKIFDGRVSQDNILNDIADYSPNVIFTTYDKNSPGFLGDYAMVAQVPVVNTFDLKDETYLSNPYYINTLTPSNYFNDEISMALVSRYPDFKLVLVGKEDDSKDSLSSNVADRWEAYNTLSLSSPGDLNSITVTPGTNYFIVGNLTDKEEITLLCEEVEKFRDANISSTISFLGRANWIVYDETLKEKFHKADVMIPARFYFDKSSSEAQSFTEEYKNLFNMTPTRAFPMYSAMGYDECLYFIPSLIDTKGDLNDFSESHSTVQSDFNLMRPTLWSGLVNPMVYLVRFSPFGTIEKQKIK